MAEDRRISLCIPTWNRFEMVFESFEQVADDWRIDEIVILDDASDMDIFKQVISRSDNYSNVFVLRNEKNLDCYRNKMESIKMANNDWAIILDSDNIITKEYIDKLYSVYEWDSKTIYTPDFAAPVFDFRHFSGLLVTKENVSAWIDEPMFETMLNACNYFVNTSEYLKVFDESIDPVTSDSIYFCYKWLEAGNRIQVVEGLKYFHRVHNGSHYKNNVARTPNGFHESILNKLRQPI